MAAISERGIYIGLKISKRHSIQISQVYALTSQSTDEEIELLYEDLSKVN